MCCMLPRMTGPGSTETTGRRLFVQPEESFLIFLWHIPGVGTMEWTAVTVGPPSLGYSSRVSNWRQGLVDTEALMKGLKFMTPKFSMAMKSWNLLFLQVASLGSRHRSYIPFSCVSQDKIL